MDFLLYDTLQRSVKPLALQREVPYRFYCCGPTVYGPAHIGNFRTFVIQDLLRRTIESLGYLTQHVRNLTDVDDKTIRQSMKEGVTLQSFTTQWTNRFHRDCQALHLLQPHVEPGAVAHIPEQIELIQILIDKGHAYRTEDGSVYYDVSSFPSYGKLSHLEEREIKTEQTDRELSDEYQRDSAADFALWKAAKPEDGANRWESPWGPGRPGWHIECSAMSMKYLGEHFDLHSGGVDLIFPHHENEIAQSEAATGKKFVDHWFHVTHLLVNGTKMSKSLGNLYTLDEIESKGYTAEELRYALLLGHYRQPLNFTFESLQAGRSALKRLRKLKDQLGVGTDVQRSLESFGRFGHFIKALLNDLNTPEALGQLFIAVDSLEKELRNNSLSEDQKRLEACALQQVLHTLGLQLLEAAPQEVPTEIIVLADQRLQARLAKDWKRADELRNEITQAGWNLLDKGSTYELQKI